MTDSIKAELVAAGAELEKTIDRFMNNNALYERFLKRLPEDPNFSLLCKAVEDGQFEIAERAAHTLKGVAANLGLEPLAELMNQMVTKLRSGSENEYAPLLEKSRATLKIFYGIIEKL